MPQVVYDRCLGVPSFFFSLDGCQGTEAMHIIRTHMQIHLTEYTSLDFYTIYNGRKVDPSDVSNGVIHVIPCLPGGKGGFGSMLRAIGAQIEKTTNREACRDLSGRRLRDINEEKRLKKWIAEQAEREREAAERKKRKLSKLCVEPKHEFSDPAYDKARSEILEQVHDAVEEGLKNAKSQSEPTTSKDSNEIKKKGKEKIKGSLWVDELEDLDVDSEEHEDSEEETPKKKIRIGD